MMDATEYNGSKEIEIMKDTVSTRSTQLASFLLAKKHRVIKTSMEGQDTFFHFTATPTLAADVQSLKFGDDLVSARALFDARSYLLSLIHTDRVLT